MKQIPIVNNMKKVVDYAIVDDEDYKNLLKFTWIKGQCYAATCVQRIIDGKKFGYTINYMHRILTNCPKELDVDHINHNKLDNRKENLRCVTKSENSLNRIIQKPGKKPRIRRVIEGKRYGARIGRHVVAY